MAFIEIHPGRLNNSPCTGGVRVDAARIFGNLKKLGAGHTIGSLINIPTRAYNVCADSRFCILPERPRRSTTSLTVSSVVSIALPFPRHWPPLFAREIRARAAFINRICTFICLRISH